MGRATNDDSNETPTGCCSWWGNSKKKKKKKTEKTVQKRVKVVASKPQSEHTNSGSKKYVDPYDYLEWEKNKDGVMVAVQTEEQRASSKKTQWIRGTKAFESDETHESIDNHHGN